MTSTQLIAQAISIACSGMFAGASVYINLVEHPARMECGTNLAATVFPGSYRRAALIQASLAVTGCISSAVAYYAGASVNWIIGGALLGAVVPFTLLGIMPTNKKLLNPKVEKDSPVTNKLLVRWGRLHAVRSVLSVASFLLFLETLILAKK